MTSHLNSHGTTDIKPEMLSGVQNGNGTPHDRYNIRGIAHARTNRKDNIFMQWRLLQNLTFILEWGQGTCSLTKQTRRWAYSRYFFHACCLLRFAAFLKVWRIWDFTPKSMLHTPIRFAMLSLFWGCSLQLRDKLSRVKGWFKKIKV